MRGEISEHWKKRYSILEIASADERNLQIVLDNNLILFQVVFDFEFSPTSVTEVERHRVTALEIEYDIGRHCDWSEPRDDEDGCSTVELVVKTVVVSLNLEHVPRMIVSSRKTNPGLYHT